jgi:hypothetical protein
VRAGNEQGLVPASYVAPATSQRPNSVYSTASTATSTQASVTGVSPTVKKKGPAVAPKRGAKKLKYCEALYDYSARTEYEYDMQEGERFVLINADTGDGWAEVEKGGTVKSVPASYIREV